MWCHRLNALLIVAVAAVALRVAFVPAVNNVIEAHLPEELTALR